MIKEIYFLAALFFITACNGQNTPPPQNNFEAPVIRDSSGLTLEQRIKLQASYKNDSNYIGKQVPRLKAEDVNGDTINQNALSSVVFYNFWFTGCAPCIAEMLYFNELAEQYKGKVDFIAITYEKLEDLPEFFDQYPFNFIHFTMNRSEINKLKLARGFPTTFVAVDGKIVSWKAGGSMSSHPSFKQEMEKQNEEYRKLFDKNLN